VDGQNVHPRGSLHKSIFFPVDRKHYDERDHSPYSVARVRRCRDSQDLIKNRLRVSRNVRPEKIASDLFLTDRCHDEYTWMKRHTHSFFELCGFEIRHDGTCSHQIFASHCQQDELIRTMYELIWNTIHGSTAVSN
jgi:hypothetical protein